VINALINPRVMETGVVMLELNARLMKKPTLSGKRYWKEEGLLFYWGSKLKSMQNSASLKKEGRQDHSIWNCKHRHLNEKTGYCLW